MRQVFYFLIVMLVLPLVGIAGDIKTDGKLKSTLASGAPLEVASSDMVVKLNADMVDGLEASDFAASSNTYTKEEVDALVAAASAADSRRAYYLTTTSHDADQDILAACDTGFHMASIWEILDPSNLKYDSVRGLTLWTSGNGPPLSSAGWIRIGDMGGPSTDCDGWNDIGTRGTFAYLSSGLSDPASMISPWLTGKEDCDVDLRVWCVED